MSSVPGSKGNVKANSLLVKAKKQFARGKRQASLGLATAEIDYAFKGEFGDAYFTYSDESDGTPHLNGHFQIDEKAYRIRRTVQGHILEKVADRLVNPEPDNPIETTGTRISPADANVSIVQAKLGEKILNPIKNFGFHSGFGLLFHNPIYITLQS